MEIIYRSNNKEFKTEKECLEYETEQAKKAEERELALKEKAAKESKEKKELDKRVQDASQKVTEAYNNLELVEEECRKIRKEASEKISKLMTEAKQKVVDAENERFKAINEFNNKFGRYEVSYEGERAYEEYKKAVNYMNKLFNSFFF